MNLRQQFIRGMPKLTKCTGPLCIKKNKNGKWHGTVSFVASQGRNKYKLMEHCSKCRTELKKVVAEV